MVVEGEKRGCVVQPSSRRRGAITAVQGLQRGDKKSGSWHDVRSQELLEGCLCRGCILDFERGGCDATERDWGAQRGVEVEDGEGL